MSKIDQENGRTCTIMFKVEDLQISESNISEQDATTPGNQEEKLLRNEATAINEDDDTLKNQYLLENKVIHEQKQHFIVLTFIKIFKLFKWFLQFLGNIFPKAQIRLPFSFKNKIYYSSRRITFCSFFILAFVLWDSYKNFLNVGKIQNLTKTTEKFKTNEELSQTYKNIKLKYDLPPIDFYFPYIKFIGDVVNLCDHYNNLNDTEQLEMLFFKSRDDFKGRKFRCTYNYDVSLFFPDPRTIKLILKNIDFEFVNGEKITQELQFYDQKSRYYAHLYNYIRYEMDFDYICSIIGEDFKKYLKYQMHFNHIQINESYNPLQHSEDKFFNSITKIIDNQEYYPCMQEYNDKQYYFRIHNLQKEIVVKPLNLMEQIYSLFSMQNLQLLYFYNYHEKTDKQYVKDDYKIQQEIFVLHTDRLKYDMQKINIQSYTLNNALSQTGGFITICLLVYGIATQFFLPRMFISSLSLYMHQNKSKIGQDANLNPKEADGLKDMHKIIKTMLSYEYFVDMNVKMIQQGEKIIEYQEKCAIQDETINLLNQNQTQLQEQINQQNIQIIQQEERLKILEQLVQNFPQKDCDIS